MYALILKDIATAKKTLLLTLCISLALSAYGIYENALFILPLICLMFPLIVSAITFGYDTKSNFERFAFAMPIKKQDYVLSKLFFAFAFGLIGAISISILLLTKNNLQLYTVLLLAVLTFLTTILISAIQLPFILKYGADKGRLVMVVTYFFIYAISTLLKENSILYIFITQAVQHSTLIIIGTSIILVILIILAIQLSVLIMNKKEF